MGKEVDKAPNVPTDDDLTVQPFTDEAGAPATLPEMGNGGEESKMKVLLGLLRKLVGVKDVANLRLSLPASLLEPIPNLEYWQYADRADIFAAIGDSPDEFERMLAVLRFSFSKELKFVRARLGKPYNSALGEHFRCSWRLPPILIDKETKEPVVRTHVHVPLAGEPAYGGQGGSGWTTPVLRPQDGGRTGSETSSVRSFQSANSKVLRSPGFSGKNKSSEAIQTPNRAIPGPGDEIPSDPDAGVVDKEKVSVVFLCEQVSHHPPVSAAYYACPERGVEAYGMDQIAAKVSGMSVKVGPGPSNKGIFVRISRDGPGKGEEYQITHPAAQVNGILKGSYYGTISDQISITCSGGDAGDGTKLRVLLDYKDESWLGKPRFLVDGVIYRYTVGNEEQESWTRAKQVPSKLVVAELEGCWMKQIRYRRKGDKEWKTLIDLDQLALIPKSVRPLEEQDEQESRRLWDPVTQNLLGKNWGEATKQKQVIEQLQRDKAAKRKADEVEFVPRFFVPEFDDGRPRLSEEGQKAIQEELERGKQVEQL